MSRALFVGGACVLTLVLGWATVVSTRAPDREPVALLAAQPRLITQAGAAFSMEALRGKTVLLNFVFTHCPSVCPTQTRALQRVRSRLSPSLRERVHFVSVTIDPERDTPEVLRAFAAKLQLNLAGWTFVTGPEAEIEALSTAYAARALPPGAQPLDHRSEVRLISARGDLMQTYAGSPLDEARLVRELAAADELFAARSKRASSP